MAYEAAGTKGAGDRRKAAPRPMRRYFSQWAAGVVALLASASALHAQTVIPYTNGQNRAAPIVLVDPAGTVLTVIVGAATQSGEISGGPLLTFAKSGAGTLTLTNANINLFADVSINAGTLAITNSTALGQGLVTLNGGALQAAANGLNVGNDFEINTVGGTIDTNGKTLTILGDIFDGNGPGGALAKIGAGTLVLDGFNDYSGATNILQGRVLATDDFALSENSAFRVNQGASLEVDDGVNAAIGSLADGPLGGGAVKIGATDPSTFLQIGLDDKDTTFSGIITGAGSLEKTGKGIQTLTGKGSSIGGILSVCDCFGEGGLDIAGGSFKADIAVFVLNSLLSVTKGGVLEQTNPFGILNFDSGKLLVDGPGSKIVVAGHTNIGGFVDDAALVIQNGGKMDSKGGAEVAAPGGAVASALVTGAGSTWNVDNDLFIGCFCTPATLTIADGGLVNSTGFTLIDVGSTLKLGVGGLAGSIVTKEIENDGFIKADFTDTSTLAAIISGPGTLTKDGSGKLILSGKSTYTGNTTVDGGMLSVNGSIANSVVKVNDGGTLGGNGIVGTTLVNSGGALGPGNSVGTLTVKNSLTFAGGSTYDVEVGTKADRTNVVAGTGPGNAALSGGAVEATFLSTGTLQKRYVILNAVGGLGGTKFTGVTDNAPGIVTSLSYDPSNVYLDNRLALSRLSGLTINQQNVADTLDKFFDVNGGIDLAFATLDPAGLTLASGELATGAMQSGFESSDRFLDVISDRFVFADGGSDGETRSGRLCRRGRACRRPAPMRRFWTSRPRTMSPPPSMAAGRRGARSMAALRTPMAMQASSARTMSIPTCSAWPPAPDGGSATSPSAQHSAAAMPISISTAASAPATRACSTPASTAAPSSAQPTCSARWPMAITTSRPAASSAPTRWKPTTARTPSRAAPRPATASTRRSSGSPPTSPSRAPASASPPTPRRRRAPEPSRSIMTAAPRPRRAASSASASTRRSCSTMRC